MVNHFKPKGLQELSNSPNHDYVESYFTTYGQILWLWSHSNLHRSWSVDIQSGLVMPPTVLNQFEIIYDSDQMPVAYCSWAFLSPENEVNYILNPSNIPLDHWKSGGNIWIIDFVSPISRVYTSQLISKLQSIFSTNVACALRVKTDSTVGRIKMFFGDGLNPTEISIMRQKKLDFFKQQLKHYPEMTTSLPD